MQNRLHPVIQALVLIVLPVIIIYVINYVLMITGKKSIDSALVTTLEMSILVIPSSLYIIMQKYHLTYQCFIVAGLASLIAATRIEIMGLEQTNSLYVQFITFIYFSMFIGITRLSYFIIKGFKIKTISFIVGAVLAHTLYFAALLHSIDISIDIPNLKNIIYTGTNTYLMIGLALAIGLLFFELPQEKEDAEYGYYDDEDDDLPNK